MDSSFFVLLCTSCWALQALPSRGAQLQREPAASRLSTSRLRPTDDFAHNPDRPVFFSFAPIAVDNGRNIERFRIRVWATNGSLVADSGEILSPDPEHSFYLEPGRYRWDVQWWAGGALAAPLAESQVVVGLRDEAWRGVPWLGSIAENEYSVEVDALGEDAELLVAALGFGYVLVNGEPVSEDLLSPSGWTNTEKRVLFRTYSIAHLLNSSHGGRIDVRLGNGYRDDRWMLLPAYLNAENQAAALKHDQVPMVFRLQILSSGRRVFHSGSPGWRKRQGRVQIDDSVYRGETLGADHCHREDGCWRPVNETFDRAFGPRGRMVPAAFPGVRVMRVDEPVSVTDVGNSTVVVDFGSNVAGVCSISIPAGAPGLPTRLELRHGEVLQHTAQPKDPHERFNPKRVYFKNLRSADARDRMVVGVEGLSKAFPRFTYHGFRYVEVYNLGVPLEYFKIQRLVIHTAVEPKVRGEFSDEVLQQIHLGSVGSQRSNLMGGIVTDCPQRDERLGWLGDAGLTAASATWHFHFRTVAEAFLDAMVDELGVDGSLPEVVPWQKFGTRPADPTWSAAFTEYLWLLWKEEGALDPAALRWPLVMQHLRSLAARVIAAGGITRAPEHYGDWCSPPRLPGAPCKAFSGCFGTAGEKAPKGFVAAFSVIRSFQQAAALGKAIGGEAGKDAEALEKQALAWREQFHKRFFHPLTKTYGKGTMVSYVLPLVLGATPEELRPQVVENLVRYIQSKNGTWTGGIVNNRFLFDVLSEYGHTDLALSMLRRKDYPSYGYMFFNDLEPARECMWEVPDAPFQDRDMNSRNHHAFSSVGRFLLERLGGLTLRSSRRELDLRVGAFAGWANVTAELARGLASLWWKRDNATGQVNAKVRVPVGMRARTQLPMGSNEDSVFLAAGGQLQQLHQGEGQGPAAALPLGVSSVEMESLEGGGVLSHVTLLSGSYELTTRAGSWRKEK